MATSSKKLPLALLLCFAVFLNACQTGNRMARTDSPCPDTVALSCADVVKLSFPGNPELDHSQKIRPDGRISLPLIGEFNAGGKTPGALQQDLARTYRTQLQNNNVLVTLEHTSAAVYVSGAVMKPGKVVLDRPMTVFEAIMEAGGFEPGYANTRKVVVLRNENGAPRSHVLDLSPALKGKPYTAFYVHPRDVIHVPQSFL